MIPNKDIFQKPVINYSRSANRRVELDFFIPNTVDLDFIETELRDAIGKIQSDITDVRLFLTQIDEPKIKLHLSFLTKSADPQPFLNARHKAINAINKIFREHGLIKISVPAAARPDSPK